MTKTRRDYKRVWTLDWLQFWSAVLKTVFDAVSSFAWPAALIWCAYIFRDQIGLVLPNLKVKYGDALVTFQLDKAESKIIAAIPEDNKPVDVGSIEDNQQRDGELNFPQSVSGAPDLNDPIINPRLSIVEASIEFDREIRKTALAFDPDMARQPLLRIIDKLGESGILDKNHSQALHELRTISNSARHEHDAIFTREQAGRYRELLNTMMIYIKLAQLRLREKGLALNAR